MISWLPMGFDEALNITVSTIKPLGEEVIPLAEVTGRIAVNDLISEIHSPSIDASLKDGYAIISADVSAASDEKPVSLDLVSDSAAAGDGLEHNIAVGTAMRILTGAEIPKGADAVLAEEFTVVSGTKIKALKSAGPGRNILPKGTDVAAGQCIARSGNIITPGLAGIIAASGFSDICVFKQPRVAIVATGDEVVAPGKPLPKGKLYASNMVTLSAFCRKWGMATHLFTAKDQHQEIKDVLHKAYESADAIITSGGAWTGDRDLVAEILLDMGWKQAFHRIRIGPGKAVGFGMLDNKPVFVLPGGPPSNLMGFLQIALPGLQALAGYRRPGLPGIRACLAADLHGRDQDWTQFIFGEIELDGDVPRFRSLGQRGRLQSMAKATAVVAIPEGKTYFPAGSMVTAQVLSF